jgi:hypothetical protein
MEKLNISVGIKRYELVEGGALLSFNPGDPNVYARYMEMLPKIRAVEQEMSGKAKTIDVNDEAAGEKTLQIMLVAWLAARARQRAEQMLREL